MRGNTDPIIFGSSPAMIAKLQRPPIQIPLAYTAPTNDKQFPSHPAGTRPEHGRGGEGVRAPQRECRTDGRRAVAKAGAFPATISTSQCATYNVQWQCTFCGDKTSMPSISQFFGIVIRMYYNDHLPSHFHAEYGNDEAVYEIAMLEILRGHLPRRAHALVIEWATLHRAELHAN